MLNEIEGFELGGVLVNLCTLVGYNKKCFYQTNSSDGSREPRPWHFIITGLQQHPAEDILNVKRHRRVYAECGILFQSCTSLWLSYNYFQQNKREFVIITGLHHEGNISKVKHWPDCILLAIVCTLITFK